MNSIFILFACFFVTSSAPFDGTGAGEFEGHDYYESPRYSFEYKVNDEHTGDVKSDHETREWDKVKGFYTLKETDGSVREAHYNSDHKNGFSAEVKRVGNDEHKETSVEPVHHKKVEEEQGYKEYLQYYVTADPKNSFNAEVKNVGLAVHPVPVYQGEKVNNHHKYKAPVLYSFDYKLQDENKEEEYSQHAAKEGGKVFRTVKKADRTVKGAHDRDVEKTANREVKDIDFSKKHQFPVQSEKVDVHYEHHDQYAAPYFGLEYKIHDEHRGDVKSHHESRKDDKVKGTTH